ncbi:MAG: rRNA pseudouridine synthase [Stenotrophomonas sp.]
MSEPIRLDKRVVALFQCSRAEAQQYIEGGCVTVDGQVVDTPQTMVDTETVVLNPDAEAKGLESATLLFNKPAGMSAAEALAQITEATRAESDTSGIRLLQRHFHRLQALMPLEAAASGLVVFSQDWRIRRCLEEEQALMEQEFNVEISGELKPYGMLRLAHGMRYEGRELPPCKVSWQNEDRLRFAIKNVRPGQLQYMCKEVGLDVVAIRRLRIGRVGLSKMPEGQWRYLAADQRF